MTGRECPNQSSVAEACHVLADPLRRAVAHEMAGRDGPVDLETLAAAVAERAGGSDGQTTPTDGGRDDARAVLLHHVHLPTLDDAGWVEYDSENRVVVSRVAEAHEAISAAAAEFETLRARAARSPRDGTG